MIGRDIELRLARAADDLDARAPTFDVARLASVQRRRIRPGVVVALCGVALTAAVMAPSAVSALRGLFDVEKVSELGALEPGVAPPFLGSSVPVAAVQEHAPFRVWSISSLGVPDEAHVREDIAGGMVTTGYEGGPLLTQWRTDDVAVRIALVPVVGRAQDVAIGPVSGLWVEGEARGTFTLVGADGAVHRESFEVSSGALLWRKGAMTFLLQRVADRHEAVALALGVRR